MNTLIGQTILIAGASGGMGRSTAVAAANAGANLILLGRSQSGLDETIKAVAAASPKSKVSALIADAASADHLETAFSGTDLDAVDALVNCIGTNIKHRSFAELTPFSWANMMDDNLTAAFNLARMVMPAMRNRKKGLIINIASTAARKPDKSGAAYQASKAGVLAMTHAIMEEEWQNGIRATAILPGMTNTTLLDKRPEPLSQTVREAALQPEDIAMACMFVLELPARAHVLELQIQPSRR